MLDTINLLTQQRSFDELNIPLAIVATEINHGREIVFTEGNVAQAVRASTSVPGVFVPYRIDDMLLVDGAVLNPTPIDIAREIGAEIVIAVDLAHAGVVCNITNVFDVIIQSIDIMERELLKRRRKNCDILIQPEIAHISPSSFEAIEECVRLGEEAAQKVMPEIKQAVFNHECIMEKGESPSRHGSR